MFCVQQLSSYDIHPHTQRAAEAAEAAAAKIILADA